MCRACQYSGIVLCMQGLTPICIATLAATVDLGTWGEEEELSGDGHQTLRDAAPYPQPPAGYNQSCFYVEHCKRNQSAIDAHRGACIGSDTAAKPMKALLTVQTVPLRPRPCAACPQGRHRWTAWTRIPGP